MKHALKSLFFFFFIIAAANFVFAEVIHLKSGKVIEADIIEETDEYIRVDFQGTSLTYYRNDIAKIEGEDEDYQTSPGDKDHTLEDGQLKEIYFSFLQALEDRNLEDVKKYMPEEDIEEVMAMAGDDAFEMMSAMSPKDLRNITEEIKENKAILSAVGSGIFGGEAEVTITFEKEDGIWKIKEINSKE